MNWKGLIVDYSANLQLPYIAPSQAQKHVTHNEALRMLDALVQLVVIDRVTGEPPAAPAPGDRYIVSDAATGAWADKQGQIAAWLDGAWTYFAPGTGWRAFVSDEQIAVVFDGSAWIEESQTVGSMQNLTLLGLGTTADATNPFAAKLNKALWTARYTGEGGDGDLRYALNKQSAGGTLSLLMQTAWSGRAEIGLVGSDDLALRVSADGTAWRDGLKIDRTSGSASFPNGVVHGASNQPLRGVIFTPGGDGQVSIWRMDASHGQNPRTATIASVASDVITLAAADASQFGRWTAMMAGVVYVRVWNTSKSPAQSAWLKASATSTTLQVTHAAHIAGWANGETLQIGDPISTTPGRVVALDISPMMMALFGVAFRQAGVIVKSQIVGGSGDSIAISATGSGGSFVNSAVMGASDGTSMLQCSELSPVSNSNLVFLRETITSSATTELLSVVAILG